MEFELSICVPQNNFQKIYRLSNSSLILNELEVRVRKSTTLPPKITFHKEKDDNTPPLDPLKSLSHYGYYANFSSDPMMLYIYYSKDSSDKESKQPAVTDSSKSPKYNTSNKSIKGPMNGNQREIIVTVLNPYLATNNIFVAKRILKLGDLLKSYKERIEWKNEQGNMVFTPLGSKDRFNPALTLSEVTNKDEIVLEVHVEGKNDQGNKRKQIVLDTEKDDKEFEFLGKKVKGDNQPQHKQVEVEKTMETEDKSTMQKEIEKEGNLEQKMSPFKLGVVNELSSETENPSILFMTGFSQENNLVETTTPIHKTIERSGSDTHILVDEE